MGRQWAPLPCVAGIQNKDFSFLPIWRFDCLWGSEQLKMKVKVAQLCPTLCNPIDIQSMVFPGQNTGVGSLSLSRGRSQPWDRTHVSHICRRLLYQLSHMGSPVSGWTPIFGNNFIYSFVSLKSSFYKKYKNTCLRVRCFCLCICLFSDKFSKWTNSLCYPLCVCVKLIQSCPTPCDPMDCSLPNSSVHEIL